MRRVEQAFYQKKKKSSNLVKCDKISERSSFFIYFILMFVQFGCTELMLLDKESAICKKYIPCILRCYIRIYVLKDNKLARFVFYYPSSCTNIY